LVTALRTWLDPDGIRFPLVELPARVLAVERVREAATLVVLGAAAAAAVRGAAVRFAAFLFVFGIWDLAYYAALVGFLGWPRRFGDWDLLFLLPVRWLAPVWAPLGVAVAMAACGGAALRHAARHGAFAVRRRHVAAAACGGALVATSFIWPGPAGALPPRYRAEWLVAGLAIGLLGFAGAWRLNRRAAGASSSADAPTSTVPAPCGSPPPAGD
jgi:hypothetical protein